MTTKIEWVARPGTTPETWNPVTGCTKVSEGCQNCYAERMARRLAGRYGYPEAPHQFDATLHPDRLEKPLRWRKPRTVFVPSMGDLFHEDVPFADIWSVWKVMKQCQQHTFLVLTKRAKRLADDVLMFYCAGEKPLPNVWLGVTAENQATADERIPLLLQTPAAVRFVSCEPLLEEINLRTIKVVGNSCSGVTCALGGWYGESRDEMLDWVIAGGESGPGARPMHPEWVQGIRDQCQAAGVPFFFKQWGAWKPIGDFDPQSGIYHYSWQHATAYKRVVSIGPDGKMYNNAYPPREGWHMARAGKKATGRLLDGREWNEWPK